MAPLECTSPHLGLHLAIMPDSKFSLKINKKEEKERK
jgi:hypothetical protein